MVKPEFKIVLNKEKFIECYNNNMPLNDIAAEFFVSLSVIYRVLREYINDGSLVKRPRIEIGKRIDIDENLIIKLYPTQTYAEIAKVIKCSSSTIRDRVDELVAKGLLTRKSHIDIPHDIIRETYIECQGSRNLMAEKLKTNSNYIESRIRNCYKKGLLPEYKSFRKWEVK